MSDRILRLFDIPYFIQREFGNEHAVFAHNTPQGVETIYPAQYLQKSNSFTSYLLNRGLQKGARVISVIGNSPEYNFAEAGILQAGGVHVPLSAFYNKKQLKDIFEIIQPDFILTTSNSNFKKLQSIAEGLAASPVILNIKTEPVFDYPVSEKAVEERKLSVVPDDTACILFTSGSTGNPKGVVLTHKNVLESVKNFSQADVFSNCKRNVSFLQLSQSAERKVNYSCQLNGITVCYPSSTKTILENITFFKPDMTALVPFLLQELHKQIETTGQIHAMRIFCGGASVPSALVHGLGKVGINVFEVYGLTETSSLLTYNTIKNFKIDTVGKIASPVQLKFSEAREILVKGDTLMQGYLLKDASLSKARDPEGWFHTGDVGVLDEDGFLKITGRIKNAFKNSRGSYVHPEEIEQKLIIDSPFEQVIILGENADSLLAVLKLKSATQNGDSNHKNISAIIRQFNADKSDDMKITGYHVWDNSDTDGVNFVSMKTDRNKVSEKVRTDKLFNFISID